MRNLVGIISLRARRTVSQAVMLDDYAKVDDVYMLHEVHGYPFSLSVRTCFRNFHEWQKAYAPNDQLNLVIEDGVKRKGDVVEVLDRDKLPTPDFRPKCSLGALQAADIMAWHVHYTVNRFEAGQLPDATDYWEIISALLKIPGIEDHGRYLEKDLRAVCEKTGTPLRNDPSGPREVAFRNLPKRVRPARRIRRKLQGS